MQLWVQMDLVKAHLSNVLSGKKGYTVTGEVNILNENLIRFRD